MNSRTKGFLCTILSAVTFGAAACLSPLTFGEGGCNPVTLAFLRGALALPALFLLSRVMKVPLKLKKGEGLSFLMLGVLGTGATALLLNSAYLYIDVGVATTIHFCYPVFVTVGGMAFYKEKISKKKLLALSVASAGILLFAAGGGGGSNVPLGAALALVSGGTYAFYLLYLDKSGLKNSHPVRVNFFTTCAQTLMLFLFGAVGGSFRFLQMTGRSFALAALISLCNGVLAFYLLQVGVKNTGASTAAILSTFEPITGMAVGCLLLNERMTPAKAAAALLILAGVLLLSLLPEKGEKTGQTQENACQISVDVV